MIFEAYKLLHSEERKEFSRGLRMFSFEQGEDSDGGLHPLCVSGKHTGKQNPASLVLAFRLPLMPPTGKLTFMSLSQAD